MDENKFEETVTPKAEPIDPICIKTEPEDDQFVISGIVKTEGSCSSPLVS